jgi:hypothetical protein
MQIPLRFRAWCLTAPLIATTPLITSCKAFDISGFTEAISSNLTGIGVTTGAIVEVGDTVRLDATGSVGGLIGFLSYAPILDAVWSVSDLSIARLELLPPPPPEDTYPHARVLVRGVKPGKVTVSAQSQGIRGSAEVKVIQTIDHIDIRSFRDTIFVGDSILITVAVIGSNGEAMTDVPLTFESSGGVQVRGYVATAQVIGIASGPATVTARFRKAAGTLAFTILPR